MVQIVRRSHEKIPLQTWTLAIVGCSVLELFHTITSMPEIEFTPSNVSNSGLLHFQHIKEVTLHLLSVQRWEILIRSSSIIDRADILEQLLTNIRQVGDLQRSSAQTPAELYQLHPDSMRWVEVAPFQLDEIKRLAEHGQLLPSGLTRFIVSPRILGLNYPLTLLNHDSSAEAKQG